MRTYYISYKGMHWQIVAFSEELAFKIWQARACYYEDRDLNPRLPFGSVEPFSLKTEASL